VETLERSAFFTRGELEHELAHYPRAESWVFSPDWLEAARTAAVATLTARSTEPDPGLPAAKLLGGAPWAGAIAPLLGLESIEGKLYLPSQRPTAVAETEEVSEFERELAEAGVAGTRVDNPELARRLEREGRLVRLGDGLAISPAAYTEAREVLVRECEQAATITLARFRDLLGASRKTAQLLLERFDVDPETLRVGDARRLHRT